MSTFMLGLNWEPNIILLKLCVPNSDCKFYIIASEASLIECGVLEPMAPERGKCMWVCVWGYH